MTGKIDCGNPDYKDIPGPQFAIYDLPMFMCRDFEGYVRFEDNRLVEINLELPRDNSWQEALADATSKYGKPDLVETDIAQNSYGARWDLQDAIWSKTDFTVFMTERLTVAHSPTRFVVVRVTDSKFWLEQHPNKNKNLLN